MTKHMVRDTVSGFDYYYLNDMSLTEAIEKLQQLANLHGDDCLLEYQADSMYFQLVVDREETSYEKVQREQQEQRIKDARRKVYKELKKEFEND